MRSFAIVIRRVYFEVKKHRKYAKNVVVNRSGAPKTYVKLMCKKHLEYYAKTFCLS